MPTAGHILREKGLEVHSIGPEQTVLQAARLMDERTIGALVVVDGEQVVGIFTERDLMRRVVVKEIDPADIKVRDVMTPKVYCCTSTTSSDAVRNLLREKRIRHVPVVDDGRLVGMLSIGDLNTAKEKVQEETILFLEQFMYKP